MRNSKNRVLNPLRTLLCMANFRLIRIKSRITSTLIILISGSARTKLRTSGVVRRTVRRKKG